MTTASVPQLDGWGFHEKIFGFNEELQAIGIDKSTRWVFNRATPQSIAHLCDRLNCYLRDAERTRLALIEKNRGANIIFVSDTPENMKDPVKRNSFILSRLIELDIFTFFYLTRSLLDELHEYILQEYIKIKGDTLGDSFNDLNRVWKRKHGQKPRKIYEQHAIYFDAIREDHERFVDEIRDPRGKIVHRSAQVELWHEKQIWYYGLTPKEYVTSKPPNGRRYKEIAHLNDLLSLVASIFEKSIHYVESIT